MLSQTFTNKIVLRKNTNIRRNIYYEDITIKSWYSNRNTYVFPINERYICSDAEFKEFFSRKTNL